MKIKGLHHIAIAVDDIKKYGSTFEKLFGVKMGEIEENVKNNVSLSFVDLENTHLEFVSPINDESPIAKYIQKKSSGIHHICLEVDDIHSAIEELKSKNVKMIDENPREGAGGSLIAFIHPDSTGGILIELKQPALDK